MVLEGLNYYMNPRFVSPSHKDLIVRYFEVKRSCNSNDLKLGVRTHSGTHMCLGPVSLTVFAHKSNSMETSPCHDSVAGHQIATIFCTCHDSTAVVPCTKFCSDHCIRIDVRVKHNFHRIWIAMEKTLVKWPLDHIALPTCSLLFRNKSRPVEYDKTTRVPFSLISSRPICITQRDKRLIQINILYSKHIILWLRIYSGRIKLRNKL